MDFLGKPRKNGYTLVRGSGISLGTGTESEYDDHCGNDQYTRNDSKSQINTVFSSIKYRVEETHEYAVLITLFLNDFRRLFLDP